MFIINHLMRMLPGARLHLARRWRVPVRAARLRTLLAALASRAGVIQGILIAGRSAISDRAIAHGHARMPRIAASGPNPACWTLPPARDCQPGAPRVAHQQSSTTCTPPAPEAPPDRPGPCTLEPGAASACVGATRPHTHTPGSDAQATTSDITVWLCGHVISHPSVHA